MDRLPKTEILKFLTMEEQSRLACVDKSWKEEVANNRFSSDENPQEDSRCILEQKTKRLLLFSERWISWVYKNDGNMQNIERFMEMLYLLRRYGDLYNVDLPYSKMKIDFKFLSDMREEIYAIGEPTVPLPPLPWRGLRPALQDE